ncbi:mechanosensitive ion channel family protein [Halomicroarcula sp. GCM10025709]|uniref:mechanosensitive ion channel family protein n=1 Tax=Haloarcula TaxID=2237 RepID=UPI0024C230EA|nr:mechanosensitive ion channel family protein [Halomicroarcula sp. YJ-61-S]
MRWQLTPPDWSAVEPYSQLVSDVATFVAVTVAVTLLARLVVVPLVVRIVRSRNRNNPTLVSATETYLQVAAVGIAVFLGLVAAGQAGFLLTTDSAILVAALTFTLGVAGQEVFGSLISGLFLVADPDFNVGDWIGWPGGEGHVEAVDFRVTRIRTPNNETVTVPNTELTTNALTRPFGRDSYRVTEEAVVAYDEDTEQALLELQQAATNHDRVIADPPPTTRIVELGPDNVRIRAEFWIDDPARGDVADVESDFRRRVKRRFDEESITLGPPAGRELSGSVAVTREIEG